MKNKVLAALEKTLEISHGSHTPLRAMEGLRGIAVFLVFLVHYCSLTKEYIAIDTATFTSLNIIKDLGNIGVDLFFVLSGYLIYGSLIRKKPITYGNYLKRRAQRIYPAFLVVMLIYIVISIAIPSKSKLPNDLYDSFILIAQNVLLLPGLFPITAINTVTWSLSYEFFYYLCIPLVIELFRLRSMSVAKRTILWIIVSAIGFIYFYTQGGPNRLLMFISGILLFELHRNVKVTLPNYTGLFALLSALILVAIIEYQNWSGYITLLTMFLLFPLCCLDSFQANSPTSKIFCFTPLRWLGNMSYSFYLIHGLCLNATIYIAEKMIPASHQFSTLFWVAWIPMLIISLVVSFILFTLIERKFSLDQKRSTVTSPKLSSQSALS